jgi:hypothetical protein
VSPDPRPGSPARPGFPGTARRSPSSAIAMSRNEDRCLCTEGDRAHTAAVAAWKDVERAEPEFAARVGWLFDAGRHKTIATLRADGSPRISGIECEFAAGELGFGSMPGVRKGRGSAAGSEVRPAWPGLPPAAGQEGRVAGRGEDRRAGGSRRADRRGACWRSVCCRHFRGCHHPAEPGGDGAGHRVVDARRAEPDAPGPAVVRPL